MKNQSKSVAFENLFIDAMVLAPEKTSGVGHLTQHLVDALIDNKTLAAHYRVRLVVPFNKAKMVRQKFGDKQVNIKKLWLPARVIELLARLHLLPPIDIFLGRGVYLFPNYKNWPLVRSKSYTYFHDLSFIQHPEYVQPKNLRYLQRHAESWIKRSSHVLTISKFSKEAIVKHYRISPDKISIVYAGVDTNTFKPKTYKEIELVCKKYSLPRSPYFLFIGNIEPRKNLERLVEAYSILPTDIKNKYGLVLIGGGGWLNDKLLNKIAKLQENGDNIKMPSKYVSDEDLPSIYSGATALMHPALYEGFGITPIEAMACYTPVALSKIEPMIEVTKGAALLFNPYSVDAIKNSMLDVVTNRELRKDLKRRGAKRSKEMEWSKTTRPLVDLLIKDAK
ncbi:MAG: glycosyltransferase family 1 protein [Patescibacteria group bacterium]